MKVSFVLATALLLGLQSASGQTTPWLTDEQARDVVAAAIHAKYPEPCYSTYRDERLESIVASVRRNRLVGNRLNNSVYFFRAASDSCDYVVQKDGKPLLMSQVSMDCCEYGIVAVDRVTAKSYWFASAKKEEIFKEFSRDEQIYPDLPEPTLFMVLYRNLVWGDSGDGDLSHLKLETTSEPTGDGATVRGYAFSGFELTVPRSDPPPKGTPKLFQWALLVKADGTVEQLPSKIIYSSR